jgi:hypothetical protein
LEAEVVKDRLWAMIEAHDIFIYEIRTRKAVEDH